jgi:hypothetical protein
MAAEDKEAKILEKIKALDLETRLQLTAINSLVLKKKELDKVQDKEMDQLDLKQFKITQELIA